MEAKDLMLFDLVKRRKDSKIMTVVELRYAETVSAITPDDIYYGDMEDYHESEINPIPLTSEILKKNGFENVSVITVGTAKMRWVSEDTRTEITIWMDDTLPMEIVKNVYYEDEVSYTLPFPGTVHQLQHALRLCGIDKEITV